VTAHLGEDAELYPLGTLDDDAARNVERHVASCSECAQRVARAQAVAASLAAALPLATPSPALERRLRESARPQRSEKKPRTNLFPFALAAAFALAFLGLEWQQLVLRERLQSEDVALVTMVHSHFNHVSMRPESANPVAAKILYARDGSWIYVIADKPGGSLHAIAETATSTVDLGVLTSTGETASLLVRPRARITSMILQRGGTNVASAKLTY
jgi:anti-sigma-K factor RskA